MEMDYNLPDRYPSMKNTYTLEVRAIGEKTYKQYVWFEGVTCA